LSKKTNPYVETPVIWQQNTRKPYHFRILTALTMALGSTFERRQRLPVQAWLLPAISADSPAIGQMATAL